MWKTEGLEPRNLDTTWDFPTASELPCFANIFEFVKANTFTHLDISLSSELGNAVHISIPISPCTSPEHVPQRQVVSTRLGLPFRNRKKRVFGYCWHFWWPSAGRLGFIPSAIQFSRKCEFLPNIMESELHFRRLFGCCLFLQHDSAVKMYVMLLVGFQTMQCLHLTSCDDKRSWNNFRPLLSVPSWW